jgi:polyisoprenoid-binding protein YceI
VIVLVLVLGKLTFGMPDFLMILSRHDSVSYSAIIFLPPIFLPPPPSYIEKPQLRIFNFVVYRLQNMNLILKNLIPLLPVALLWGCSNPADKVPAANVSSTNATETAKSDKTSDSPAARTFVINPEGSTINFIGSKVTGKHDGGFKQFSGELKVANGKLADAGNKVVIQMDSLWTDTDRLTGHLKSPDFFNAAQIPTATFETTSITQQATNSLVTGNLTLHGVTKQISFPANIQVSNDAVDLAAEFFINRFDFQVKYPGKANDLIRKEVVLKLKVKATPSAAKA